MDAHGTDSLHAPISHARTGPDPMPMTPYISDPESGTLAPNGDVLGRHIITPDLVYPLVK